MCMHSERTSSPSRAAVTSTAAAAREVEPALRRDPGQSVAQQIDAGLQVGHPHAQRLMLEQHLPELAPFHHAGQRDSDDPLTYAR